MTIGAQSAQAKPYSKCDLSEHQANPAGSKPSYNTFLSSRKVKSSPSTSRCAKAYAVLRGYHSCRAKTSITCNNTVRSHWHCTAAKTSSGTSAFLAKVTCKWGARRVYGEYEQQY
jgi:hypothetical protein